MSAGTNRSIPTPVSVPNGGTGLAAGTSGGIPAYTGATTIASSGVLAAYELVIGGGAGVAPSTTTTGAGVLVANINRPVFATTVTAGASTLTLTVTSAATQEFTGTNYHLVRMPSVDTLVAGCATLFINKSTDTITIRASDDSSIITILSAGQSVSLVCNDIAGGTTAAAWDVVGLSPLEFTAKPASDQSFAFNVDETVIFQGAVGLLASALNGATGVFTAPKAGTIILSGVVAFTVNGSSEYDFGAFISYSKNAGATVEIAATDFTASSGNPAMSVPFNFPLSVTGGDTVEIVANLQDNAGGGTFLVKSYSGWTVKYV